MNKLLKTILIGLIAVFSAGFLFVDSAQAQPPENLVVEFEQTPLFNEANFLPGESVTRFVKVTNNSTQSQRIATEAINKSDPNWLGNVLNLEIKEGGATRYNDALSKFFATGEVFLSNLAGNGAKTQYDFIVTFYSGAGNPFQGKSLGFDILVGFQGEEGGLLPGAGGGAGGFLPPGLTIQDESVRVTTTTETSVTITWTTSYLSTSQVIYAKEVESHILDLTDNVGTPPKYGYARTTPEYDVSPKVTFHSVTIYGLTSGTTYYFRAVSHASLAVSREYTFTTKGIAGAEIEEEIIPLEEEIVFLEEGIPFEEKVPGPEELIEQVSEEIAEEVIVEQEAEKKLWGNILTGQGLLAAIGAIPFNLKVILILAGVIIIGLLVLRLARKRKIKS